MLSIYKNNFNNKNDSLKQIKEFNSGDKNDFTGPFKENKIYMQMFRYIK
jgi:hypothetical protein